MKSAMITAERRLEDQLHAAAREILGPAATEAEVQTLADREYYGPELPEREETAAERRQWEEDLERQRAQVRRWGLPKP